MKAVIFDLDGVLIDSMPFYAEAWRKAFELHGLQVGHEEIYHGEGLQRKETVRRVYRKHRGLEPDDMLIDAIGQAEEAFLQEIFSLRFMPGALSLLDELRRLGRRLALVTGSTELAAKFADQAHILRHFEVIVTGDLTERGKPAPDPYHLALQNLALDAEHCCVVENAPLGIQAAKAAGLYCVALRASSPLARDVLQSAGADHVCDDFSALRTHILDGFRPA